ncbi:MAG: tetratricopeptide repeat protein [Patescibacteria group bacterium]|nr:tetratricopeptide repeat protein [Patescibacteria group bacterium]
MNKKKVFIIAIILIVILALGYFLFTKIKVKQQPIDKDLIKINTGLEMDEKQQTTYNEIIEKLNKDKDDYSALIDLARLKQDLLDYDGAIELYNYLLTIKPKDGLVLNNLANVYYNLKNYEKAEEIYLFILDFNPKWTNSYNELFSIYRYHLKDKQSEIEPLLLNGIEKYPEMKIDLMSKLALYYDEMVLDKNKAIEEYQAILELDPENEMVKGELNRLKN